MNAALLKSGFALAILSFSPIIPSLAYAADLNSPSLDSAVSVPAQPCNMGGVTGFSSCVGSRQVMTGETAAAANQILNSGVFDGITDWTFDVNLDPNQTGPNILGVSQTGLGSITGTLKFSRTDLAQKAIAIVLRTSNAFSIYYIPAGTLQSASDLSWNTLGVSTDEQGNPQDLTQVSVYFSDRTEAAFTVPPLGVLGAGLAALPALLGGGSGSSGGGSGVLSSLTNGETGFLDDNGTPDDSTSPGDPDSPDTPNSNTPIPAPVLLPGILGVGIAVLRRRKTEIFNMKSKE